jgi:hypothetical protein
MPCDAGFFSTSGEGQTAPSVCNNNKCEAGRYSTATGLTSNNECTPCETGRYSNIKGLATLCTICKDGDYQDQSGQTTCLQCSKGTYLKDTVSGRASTQHDTIDRCLPCKTSHFQDQLGKDTCKSCDKVQSGYITTASEDLANHDGEEDCIPPPTTSDGGFNCVAGQRKLITQKVCEDCPQGYKGDENGESCILCPVGFYQDQKAQQTCKACTTSEMCALSPGATSDAATTKPEGLTLRVPTSNDDSANDFGAADTTDTSSDATTTTTTDTSNIDKGFSSFADQTGVQPERLATYILCAFLGLLVILLHRKCPDKIKSLDLFSDKHVVEDSHALRNLETKLGAGFTLALIFVVGAIVLFITDPANNFIKSSGLKPGTLDLLPNSTSSYQHVLISTTMFAARTDAKCTEIQFDTPGEGLKVVGDSTPTETIFDGVGIECKFFFNCTVSPTIRGTKDFVVTLPEFFQWMEWKVESSFWSPDLKESRFGSILATNSTVDKGKILAGTTDDPTTLTFGAIRSSHFDEFKDIQKFALQLFWRGTEKTLKMTTGAARKHMVAFRFQVEENVYVSKLLKKLNVSSMLSVSFKRVEVVVNINWCSFCCC